METIDPDKMSIGQIVDLFMSLDLWGPSNPGNSFTADLFGGQRLNAFRYGACEHFPERFGVSFQKGGGRGGDCQFYYDVYFAAKAVKEQVHNEHGTTAPYRHGVGRCTAKYKNQ